MTTTTESASYSQMHFGPTTTPSTNSAGNCSFVAHQTATQDSDCGSSGLGTAKHEGGCSSDVSSVDSRSRDSSQGVPKEQKASSPASDVGGLPTEQAFMGPKTWLEQPPPSLPLQPPVSGQPGPLYTMTMAGNNVYDRGGAATLTRTAGGLLSAGPTVVPPQTPPSANGSPAAPVNATLPTSHPLTANGTHEIFVHVPQGRKINLYNSMGECKSINGPATIRMTGTSATSPAALPLHVPEGHLVQQILDEQGRLKHVILTTEPPPTTSAGNSRMPVPTGSRSSGATTPSKPVLNAVPSTSNGASPKSVSPPAGGPAYPGAPVMTPEMMDASYYSTQSQMRYPPWIPTNNKRPSTSCVPMPPCHPNMEPYMVAPLCPPMPLVAQCMPPYVTPLNAQVPDDLEFEEDERERDRLKETLNSIQPPVVTNIYSKEVEITWQAIDTSEAAASGGPFPQIDASEFVYEIFVYDPANPAHTVSSHRCEQTSSVLRINRLRSNTNYSVNIRASLPDRDLFGYPSALVNFRTKTIAPDVPGPPKIGHRGPTWLMVNWRNSIVPGQVKKILVQMAKNEKKEQFQTVFEGTGEQTKVTHLEPGTSYKVRIIARNDIGDSEPSAPAFGMTPPSNMQQPHHHQQVAGSSQQQPSHYRIQPPFVTGSYNRSIKLVWTPVLNPNNYTLEYSDSKTSPFIPVPQECYSQNGAGATVSNLQSNRDYLFRLHVVADNGQEIRTEATPARTRRDQYENSSYQGSNPGSSSSAANFYDRERPAAPVNLAKNFVDDASLELTWRYPAREFDGLTFVVEGAPLEDGQPSESSWKVCYKGQSSSCIVNDQTLALFRVQSLNNRKRTFSAWSEVLTAKRQPRVKRSEPVNPPAVCTTPKFINVTWCSLDVEWKLSESVDSNSVHPLIYELQRIDTQPITVYSGEQSQCKLENLKPVEHVQVRARAVIVDYEGKRNEGVWSPIASTCTLYNAPSEPLNLDVLVDNRKCPLLVWEQPADLNGSDIVKYMVSAARNSKDEVSAEKLGDSFKTEFELERLAPATEYSITVVAVNKGGVSRPSKTFEFVSPPSKPSPPSQLHVEALSSAELKLSWTASHDNGSPLTCYRLAVHEMASDSKTSHIIAQRQLSGDSTSFFVENLKPETLYKLDLSAENGEGVCEVVSTACETFAPPPDPPELSLSQAQANLLKLKWVNQPSSSSVEPCHYYLERQSENGHFSRVYDGIAKFAKVKGLKEASVHRFRIRATNAKGVVSQTGPWSKTYEFTTTKMPPPTIRGSPSVTEISQCVFQIEWPVVRLINNNNEEETNDVVVYRLQIAPKPDRKGVPEQWKVVYEGTCPSYTLTVSPTSTITRVCRVFVVQKLESEELCSTPSLISSFTTTRTPTESPKKRAKITNSGSSTPNGTNDSPRSPSSLNKNNKMSLKKMIRKLTTFIKQTISESNGALIIMLIFFMFAVVIAFILNNYYQL